MKNTAAEILVHPSGKLLFCSVRGDDSIAAYTIDEATGRLTPAAHQVTKGEMPRNFAIDPTGKFLIVCNQGSNNVFVFRIDQESGHLLQIDDPKSIPEPVCVRFAQ
jgi:6-phosphogluconolactonase